MKKILLVIAGVTCIAQSSFAKVITESAAKTTAQNFWKSKGQAGNDLSLSYKAISTVNGANVAALYVYSTSAGFVIVSGDDNVTPILGFSEESSFDYSKISPETAYWLSKYQLEIAYVMAHNTPASPTTTNAWEMLQSSSVPSVDAKTTNVPYLVHSTWNQSPLYNAMCPKSGVDTALTGCVATAMVQVMKYWKWPATGTGSHSYNASGYGMQTANFGVTTYNWTNMPNSIITYNDDVEQLNYQAGVSVNMGYGATESGSYVTIAESPIINCAEYALKTYFNYVPTLHGVFRTDYDDSTWVSILKNEFTHARPVIYSGFGSAGGHCWIGDGFTTFAGANYIHFNWGWGGYCNGNFLMNNLAPAGNNFNTDQTAIIGIRPNDGTIAAGVAETVVTGSDILVYPNPATEAVTIDLKDNHMAGISITDMMGREIYSMTPVVTQSLINIPVSSYPAGIYILQMTNGGNTITRKVVVSK